MSPQERAALLCLGVRGATDAEILAVVCEGRQRQGALRVGAHRMTPDGTRYHVAEVITRNPPDVIRVRVEIVPRTVDRDVVVEPVRPVFLLQDCAADVDVPADAENRVALVHLCDPPSKALAECWSRYPEATALRAGTEGPERWWRLPLLSIPVAFPEVETDWRPLVGLAHGYMQTFHGAEGFALEVRLA